MSDDAPPPSPDPLGIPARFIVIGIIVVTFIAARFIPIRTCPLCQGKGKRIDIHHPGAPLRLPCDPCAGNGTQTFIEIVWPVWGS